tara:strand:+ start:324 stop:488 length:165 start_codon:yes stop_codon:yes gene_type:complete
LIGVGLDKETLSGDTVGALAIDPALIDPGPIGLTTPGAFARLDVEFAALKALNP